jgi:transcriptional regulator with XRE-family HTH domain
MTAGERLRAWRTGEGLSQAQAGLAVGVGQNTWSDWEHDRKKPHVERAIAIERATRGKVRVEHFARAAAV